MRITFRSQRRTDIPGALVGEVNTNGDLVSLYQHLSKQRELITGRCRSTLEVLETGRYRLSEPWWWTSSYYSSDHSLIEEVER